MERATKGILDVARGVLAELDLDQVLDRVLESAQELTEARYAALGVLNEPRTELARFLTKGIEETEHTAIGVLPRGRGVLGALISDPRPLRLGDVGQHPRSYGFPAGHPPMHSFLGVPILVGGTPFGNLYLTEKADGAQFTDADEQAVGVLAEFAGVAIDHARRYTGARERRDELERTVATLEATTQIARAVGGETDLEVILELVAKRGRALVSARALLIELRQRNDLVIAAGAGDLPAELIGRCVALEDTVASHAMRTGRTQRLEDELNRARFEDHGLGQFGVRAAGGLAVPLVFRGRTHGVLLALDRLHDGPAFSTEDERLLEAFAVSAASAVATAQSIASERHRQRLAAAEGERRRWARELHDETLQSLSALRIGLSTAGRSDRPEALGQAVRVAVDHLEEAIANLRGLITDLRPAALDELGVKAALEGLAERVARHGVEVDVSVELAYEQGNGATRHLPELETAIYRIVQEALTNASKHGHARRAVVEIHEEAAIVHLSVRDDGRGFDPHNETDGFGLLGMRERVELLGGELLIDSASGRGTVLTARIPVQRLPDDRPAAGRIEQLAGG
ncbi:MAG TPA: GAF domain-containing protein [Solirubrobacteraceae bacterium]|nr:GAF domain-containing protein [Solirubrobacteraceae bacterium]